MNSSNDEDSQHESNTSNSKKNVKQSLFNLSQPSAQQINNTTIVIRPNNGVDLKLFVGQIPKEWDEDMVSKFFSGYGEILETQIMKDTKTGQSKGCAFVKFASMTKAEEAKKMIEAKAVTLPGANHPIQIKWADGEDQRLGVDEQTIPKLFVGSIPKQATEENLRDVFSQFGVIEELIIMKDPVEGTPKGSAFIKFKTKEEAIVAVRILNGNVYLGGSDRPMEVRFAEVKKKAATSSNSAGSFNSVKSPYAVPPINPMVPMAQTPGLPFYKYTTADGTPYYLNPYTKITQWEEPPPGSLVYPENGAPYYVKSAVSSLPQRPGPAGCNLFIFYIPAEWSSSDDTLYSYFKDFGSILSCRIMKDRSTNRSKGFGFVSYDNPASAQIAIQRMNGLQVGTKRIKVELKKEKDGDIMTNGMTSAMKFNPY